MNVSVLWKYITKCNIIGYQTIVVVIPFNHIHSRYIHNINSKRIFRILFPKEKVEAPKLRLINSYLTKRPQFNLLSS